MELSIAGNFLRSMVGMKPRTLGEGAKRVARYATMHGSLESIAAKFKHLQIKEIKTIGTGDSAVQIREYTNGVTMYANKNGLFVLGANEKILLNILARLVYEKPIIATNRQISKEEGLIEKFYKSESEVHTKSWIIDEQKQKLVLKDAVTEELRTDPAAFASLGRNRGLIFDTIKSSEKVS